MGLTDFYAIEDILLSSTGSTDDGVQIGSYYTHKFYINNSLLLTNPINGETTLYPQHYWEQIGVADSHLQLRISHDTRESNLASIPITIQEWVGVHDIYYTQDSNLATVERYRYGNTQEAPIVEHKQVDVSPNKLEVISYQEILNTPGMVTANTIEEFRTLRDTSISETIIKDTFSSFEPVYWLMGINDGFLATYPGMRLLSRITKDVTIDYVTYRVYQDGDILQKDDVVLLVTENSTYPAIALKDNVQFNGNISSVLGYSSYPPGPTIRNGLNEGYDIGVIGGTGRKKINRLTVKINGVKV